MANQVYTHNLSQPLEGAAAASFDIHAGDGNLNIDALSTCAPLLASGELEHTEKQGPPACTLNTSGTRPTLKLKAGSAPQRWLHLPWSACNGATTWRLHLNPDVQSELTALSNGGNIHLDLSTIHVTRVTTETGGGNIDVALPENAASLAVTAKSGAGNVDLRLPGSLSARIYATSGLGKVTVDPRFTLVDKFTYQSPDYDRAVRKAEIKLTTGAGNVTVSIL